MKPNDTTPRFTRRSTLALILAGATLPQGRSLAAPSGARDVYLKIAYMSTATQLQTCSGESLSAWFESELLVGTDGTAKGFMHFTLGSDVIEYVAERSGLDFDSAGVPLRAVVLLSRRGSSGKDARDFMLASVAPDPLLPEDCLIYTTAGSQVHVEPMRFEVPGAWEVRRTRG
jgi:hypothetical protein